MAVTAARALLVGATGLVGRELLRLLLVDDATSRVIVLVRRPLPAELDQLPGSVKLEAHVVDFEHLERHRAHFRVRHVFCALGTTIRQAGSQERFRRVDHDYPLSVARLALAEGAVHFLLVSAIGANARSRVFYNRVKGELEDELLGMPFRSITIVRPSLLLGERRERRLGEEIGRRLAFLAPRRYKPSRADRVAEALVESARAGAPGRRFIESTALL